MPLHKDSAHVYFRDDGIGVALLESLMANTGIDRIEYVGEDGEMVAIRSPVVIIWKANTASQLGELARRLALWEYLKERRNERRRKRYKERKRRSGHAKGGCRLDSDGNGEGVSDDGADNGHD